MMNESKNIVLDALNFKTPIRLPVFDGFWGRFEEIWRKNKKIGQSCDIRDYYGNDISVVVADECFYPSRAKILSSKDGCEISDDGWGRTKRTRAGSYFSETIDVYLKEKGDLERLEFEPASMDLRYEEFQKKVELESKKRCVFCKIGGPFIRSSFIRGETQYLIDIAEDEPFARELAQKVGDHLIQIGLESLKRGDLYDTGLWIYDDMANNITTMFSPKSFEKIFYPVYKNMISAFRKAGVNKIVLHSDGNMIPFLDMLIDLGIDAINPVEYRSGMKVPALLNKYGRKMGFIGGACNGLILPRGNTEEITNHIMELIEAGKNGGFILGLITIAEDISIESYELYRSLLNKFGRYKNGIQGKVN